MGIQQLILAKKQFNRILYKRNAGSSFLPRIHKSLKQYTGSIYYSLLRNPGEASSFVENEKSFFEEEKAVVKQMIYQSAHDKIILDACGNDLIIEHLFLPQNIELLTFSPFIKTMLKEAQWDNFILGFELNIDIHCYEDSLQKSISGIDIKPVLF